MTKPRAATSSSSPGTPSATSSSFPTTRRARRSCVRRCAPWRRRMAPACASFPCWRWRRRRQGPTARRRRWSASSAPPSLSSSARSTRRACRARCGASPRTRRGPRLPDGDELRRRHDLPEGLLRLPDLLLRHRPAPLPPLLAGADLLLQQHLARAGAAARAQPPQRPHPPQPPQPPAPRPLLPVDLQPLAAHGARGRLLGPRRDPRGLAHVPQVLLHARRHGRRPAHPPAAGQRRGAFAHAPGDLRQPVPAGAALGLGCRRRALRRPEHPPANRDTVAEAPAALLVLLREPADVVDAVVLHHPRRVHPLGLRRHYGPHPRAVLVLCPQLARPARLLSRLAWLALDNDADPHTLPLLLSPPHLRRRAPAAAGAASLEARARGGPPRLAGDAAHHLPLLRPPGPRLPDPAAARPAHGVPRHGEGLRRPSPTTTSQGIRACGQACRRRSLVG